MQCVLQWVLHSSCVTHCNTPPPCSIARTTRDDSERLSLTHTNTLARPFYCSRARALSLSLFLNIMQKKETGLSCSLSHTHSHTHITSRPFSVVCPLSLALSLSLSHTHTLSLFVSVSREQRETGLRCLRRINVVDSWAWDQDDALCVVVNPLLLRAACANSNVHLISVRHASFITSAT